MNDSLLGYIAYFFKHYGHQIVEGTLTTLWLVPVSLFFGLLLATPCGMVLASRKHPFLRFPAWLFCCIFRGTPMLIQLYLIYFALGLWMSRLPNLPDCLHQLLRNKEFWGILCLSLNTAAYTAEIIRGAIETAPKGEIEAARAFGMSAWQIQRRIIFPGVLRRALPSYSNEVIFMLHGSSIVSTIAVTDLTQVVRNIYGKSYEPYLPFITAGLIYLSITMIIFSLFRLWERYLYRSVSV